VQALCEQLNYELFSVESKISNTCTALHWDSNSETFTSGSVSTSEHGHTYTCYDSDLTGNIIIVILDSPHTLLEKRRIARLAPYTTQRYFSIVFFCKACNWHGKPKIKPYQKAVS
jgi:hypothetical protein